MFKGNGSFLGGCKEGDFEQNGMKEDNAQVCWPQAAWYCSELLVVFLQSFVSF